MEDYELTLFDRIEVIKTTNSKYDLEQNAYLSFSGGKDSTVLHYLLDIALPNNRIPRVYVDTGIGLNMIDEFVRELASKDERIKIIKTGSPIKQMLEKYGYPFKSKLHSYLVEKYQRLGLTDGVKNYLGIGNKPHLRMCPQKLRYQFTEEFKIKISDLCCLKMKEEPMTKWAEENHRTIAITGIMIEEGGRRTNAKCIVNSGKITFFNPLSKVNKDFEEWLIEKFHLEICKIYYPPYNAERTGCKGCPFALHLQNELDFLEKYLPIERKQCEIIWKPIYDEYRRIGYRLRKEDNK